MSATLLDLHKLMRPGDDKVVAIVSISKDGKATLNPDCFDYGLTPRLSRLTAYQAQALWAETLKSGGKWLPPQKTYELISTDHQVFFLDLEFNELYLRQYRVRGPKIQSPSWIAV